MKAIRANGGAPVRAYSLPAGMVLEVYQRYPGYVAVVERDGQRFESASFKGWREGRYQYAHSSGEALVRFVGELVEDAGLHEPAALALRLRQCWHPFSDVRAAPLLHHRPPFVPALRDLGR
jgi:hypothetical protein